MIDEHERLIIISGMAHSGTTILTYLLQQHPEVVCCVNGSEACILENDWLLNAQTDKIAELLKEHSTKQILLKRPWTLQNHTDWHLKEIPNARYVYCWRPFENIANSWSKPTSLVDDLRDVGIAAQRHRYQKDLCAAAYFESIVLSFYRICNDDLLTEPDKTLKFITNCLGLSDYQFDISQVVSGVNIKDLSIKDYKKFPGVVHYD